MALPAGGQAPKLLQHSAGKVCIQDVQPDPAFYQTFNANLGDRPQKTMGEDL